MFTRNRYTAKEIFLWSRFETLFFVIYVSIVAVLYEILDMRFLEVPWTPVALVGTAVAFIVGFQNNSAYDRAWEARKIWGGIVNTSRTFGMKVETLINNKQNQAIENSEIKKIKHELVFRHIAWLTALRHQLRQQRQWENHKLARTNREWTQMIMIPETLNTINDDLKPYLSEEERLYVLGKNNRATALLYNQSQQLEELYKKDLLPEFSFNNLNDVLEELFTLQGKSERIKNFPYPRQYATLGHQFLWIFLILLPFGIVPEFDEIGNQMNENYSYARDTFVWMAIPFCAMVSWVFHLMERIGRVTENPFEGTPNDVPISTIARGIEIDMRQQMDESIEQIPDQFPEYHNVQM